MEFGPGLQLAAQCVPLPPPPNGWRPWFPDVDGPFPEALETRARALAVDTGVPLGATESFPLPGVTPLIRVEPRVWSRSAEGGFVQGCFRAAGVYLPGLVGGETVAPPASANSKLERTIGVLTVGSLVVGIAATLYSWGR